MVVDGTLGNTKKPYRAIGKVMIPSMMNLSVAEIDIVNGIVARGDKLKLTTTANHFFQLFH